MRKVKVIGVGPGSHSLITPEARASISEAALVIGGKRHLESFCRREQQRMVLANNLEEVLEVIRSRQGEGVAVLATGDPGMYGILHFLRERLGPGSLEVLPGISSIQLAFARLCLPWHDFIVFSAHGRPVDRLLEDAERASKYAVLTGGDNPPEKIFSFLEKQGIRRKYYFCFDLSLPGEEILQLESGQCFPGKYSGRHNCVMVIENEQP